MATIKMITEKEAKGEVKSMFEQIKQMFGDQVPLTFQAMANQPEYLKLVIEKIKTVMDSEEVDKKTKLAVAYTVSVMNNCEACITMYTQQLKDAGFTDKQIVEILSVIDLAGSMNHFNNGTVIKPH
jgi:AhpD family alkylhydroperoxidase